MKRGQKGGTSHQGPQGLSQGRRNQTANQTLQRGLVKGVQTGLWAPGEARTWLGGVSKLVSPVWGFWGGPKLEPEAEGGSPCPPPLRVFPLFGLEWGTQGKMLYY